MNMVETIHQLVELHAIDTEILKLKQEIQRLPQRLEALNQQQATWQRDVDAKHDEWKRVRQEREEKEQQVSKLEQQMENLQQAARQARSNREYSEYLLKVEEVRHRIRKAEDELLDFMEAEDRTFQEWKAAEKTFKEKVKNLDQQRAELKDRQAHLQGKLAELEARRAESIQRLPKDVRELYHYIASNRGGLAMAAVRDQTCTACHIQLRPRVYQSLKLMEDLIQCESCSRILYLPEMIAERSRVASQG